MRLQLFSLISFCLLMGSFCDDDVRKLKGKLQFYKKSFLLKKNLKEFLKLFHDTPKIILIPLIILQKYFFSNNKSKLHRY